MNDRERFLACVLGEPVDRPPFYLFWGPWGTVWQQWLRDGMPAGPNGWDDVRRHFGADAAPHAVPINCGPCPPFPPTVLEEDDEAFVHTDTWGIKRRNFKRHESMSEFLEFPVRSRRDWERYKAERLDPKHPDRLAGPWREKGREWMGRGVPIQLGYFPDVGLYGGLRWLLGDEECLLAFYDDPALVHEIMDHLTTIYLAVFEEVVREVRVDVIHIWEDMCGRQGPLISPAHWEEFMGPNYRRIHAFAQAHGIRVISVDTDGQPELLIPPMMRSGVNLLFPMEVAAGCDVVATRRRHPGLALLGGIDKRALAIGPEAIDRELARIRPAIRMGRYIPDLDHLIPDDVSWANFCYFATALKREVIGA